MNINKEDTVKYVEGFLNTIFDSDIHIDIQGHYYLVNNKIKYNIYDFWNMGDEELLNDFNNYSFKEDYIGTIFFFLSGYWEYTHSDIKDNYGRYPAKESFCFKKGILEEPVVDMLVNCIAQQLNICYSKKFIIPKILLTHDIDYLLMMEGFKFFKSLCADILKRKDLKSFFDKILKKILSQDPHSVEHLINLHKEYDTKGTFFFMPDTQLQETEEGYNPLVKGKYFKDIKKQIISSGSSFGIHYDLRYLEENRMKKDIERLEKAFDEKIDCGRAHYLIFDIIKSFDIYEKSGIKLDSTCSYADMTGFRFGTSYPFKPYSFKERRAYNLFEVPLIAMDVSLQDGKYMNLPPEEGFQKLKELMDRIKRYNGIFTLLWHNTSFYTREWEGWEWVYEKTIRYGKENGFQFINLNEIFI